MFQASNSKYIAKRKNGGAEWWGGGANKKPADFSRLSWWGHRDSNPGPND